MNPELRESFRSTMKESFLILMFEFLGSVILSCLVNNYYSQDIKDNTGLLLGIFICIIFSARISGSHFNPAITLSYMIGNVKHGSFDRVLGFLYIAVQVVGGILGAIFGTIYSKNIEKSSNKIELSIEPSKFVQQIILEVIASFFLVFMYLCSTDVKTKFTKDAAIQTIILSGSYLGAMLLAGTNMKPYMASPVNPAIALGIVTLNLSGKNFQSGWIFLAAPFGGSVLALLFFRFIYKKTQEQALADNEDDEHNSAGLMEANEALITK